MCEQAAISFCHQSKFAHNNCDLTDAMPPRKCKCIKVANATQPANQCRPAEALTNDDIPNIAKVILNVLPATAHPDYPASVESNGRSVRIADRNTNNPPATTASTHSNAIIVPTHPAKG